MATWVYCAKCGSQYIGDDTLKTCPGCKRKARNRISNNLLDRWDWLAISLIPAFGTLFLILETSTHYYF